jgi:hypothetical protein
LKNHTLNITQNFNAPISEVFAILADHNQLSRTLGVPVKRIKDGKDSPNGIGSVRRLGPAPIGTQETVVTLEVDRLIEYKITKFGGPIQNHHGRQTFSETDNGCKLSWEITFSSFPIVGDVIAMALEAGLTRGLAALAKRM